MAFPQQAKINMNFARIAVRLFVMVPLLTIVHSEPDALIRFADGSVVEIENRPLRQQLLSSALSSATSLSPSSTSPSSSSSSSPSSPLSLALSLPSSISSSSLSPSAETMNPSSHHNGQQQARSLLHDNNHRIETRSTKQHFCGDLLVNALALVCKGSYKKRSRIGSTTQPSSQNALNFEIDSPYFGDLSIQNKNDNDNNLPDFFELIKAASGHHERQTRSVSGQNGLMLDGIEERPAKRGVVDECCKKPCSTTTLSQYCGNDFETKSRRMHK